MRHRHDPNQFPRQPHKLITTAGEVLIVYFEKHPDSIFSRENVESWGFRNLLNKQYDFRTRGCGRERYFKLLSIKRQWETGGMAPPRYVPCDQFMELGRVLDPSSGEVNFPHKNHRAFPQLL